MGETMVLVTATAAKSVREGIDFFPLTVDIEERAYAAGKIPGSFFRREGRPTEAAILTCRLIDRPLRPCFPDGFRNETQVVITVIGADQENPHDVAAINAASPSARCASPTARTATGSPIPPGRRVRPAPSSSSWPAASSTTATSPS
jgi:polyribonucleotide nucleotidyltransferase